MKFTLYCSCLQSDRRKLRFVRRFDSLSDVTAFVTLYSKLLCSDWKLVQSHTNTTLREREQMSYKKCEYYEQDLPF